MKKGEGCENLYLLRICDGKRLHRCCRELGGFMLKHWRCVGRESKECPKHPDTSISGGGTPSV